MSIFPSYPRTDNLPKTHSSSPETLSIYTDGSKTENDTAHAVVLADRTGIKKIYQRRLPREASIFEAEAYGIMTALEQSEEDTQNNVIKIYTDSKSVLQSINARNYVPQIIYKIQEKMNKLSKKSQKPLRLYGFQVIKE